MITFFDLATRTGWAAGRGGVEDFGSFELRRTGENVGEFLFEAQARIEAIARRFRPTLMAFEAPFLVARRDTMLKVRKLSGLANEVEKCAYSLGMAWHNRPIDCREALVDDVRRHFLGRDYPRTREAAKIATKVKCRDLGWDVDNDDEADALAGLSFMHALEAPEQALDVVPLFQWKPKPKMKEAA